MTVPTGLLLQRVGDAGICLGSRSIKSLAVCIRIFYNEIIFKIVTPYVYSLPIHFNGIIVLKFKLLKSRVLTIEKC